MTDSNIGETPIDPRRRELIAIQNEIDADRKHEWVLIPKALLALVAVAVLVVIRQLFFV
jgi:hypothetical protein